MGKLQVLQKHYEALGRMSEDSDFDGEWKEGVENKVSMCSRLLCEDEYLDGELCKGEIEKCVCKLKNSKTGGSDGLVGELLKYGGGGMVTCCISFLKLFGMRKPYLCSGGKG